MKRDKAADELAGDPGLAAERTELAWRRTAISFAAVGAAITKLDPPVGVPVIGMAVAIWVLGARRSSLHRRLRAGLITAVTTLIAIGALVIAILSPGHPLWSP